jgi:hypothetical protein
LFKYLDPITEGLSEERKNQLIEAMTRKVVEHSLIAPMIVFLESVKPMAKVGSYTLILFSAPILGLFGINGYELVGFFSERENLEKLMKSLEEAAKK